MIPGRAVRATARLADVIAVSFAATCAALSGAAPGVPCYVTGTPIRDTGEIDRDAARERLGDPDRRARAPHLRRLAGGPPVQHRGVRGDRPARRARDGDPRDGRRRRTRRRWRTARRCRADLRARYRPYPFLRDEMLPALAAADLVVGRAGSSTLAEVERAGRPHRRRAVSARRRPPAGERAGPRRGRRGAARGRRGLRRRGPARARRRSSTIRPATSAMSAAARTLGRPGAADAVADLVLARGRAPAPARSAPSIDARGPWRRDRPRDRRVRRHRDRHRDPAPDRRQDVARRTARPVHDDAGRRSGRPVRRRCTTPSSCAPWSASPGRARSRTSCWGGAATSSSATRVCGAS